MERRLYIAISFDSSNARASASCLVRLILMIVILGLATLMSQRDWANRSKDRGLRFAKTLHGEPSSTPLLIW